MSNKASTSKSRDAPGGAYQRYKAWIARQIGVYGSRLPALPQSKTDLDVLKEHHQFLRDSTAGAPTSWEDSLALRWYNKLFKEFALIDLKHFKSGNIALRWRTEEEVIGRTGELTCGNLRCGHHLASLEPRTPSPLPRHDRRPKFNHEADYVTIGGEEDDKEEPLVPISLHPFQLDFEYVEMGEMKTALVKVILCKDCSKKLNYRAERKRREGSAGREIDRSPEETTVVNGKGRPKLHPRRERSRSPVRRSREELIPRRRDRSRSPRRR